MARQAHSFGGLYPSRKCHRHLVRPTIKQRDENWVILQNLLVQNFAHQNSAQTALQQLETWQQEAHKPMGQFGVHLNQLLIHADPTMPEHVKLFFLWPRMCHDITRRARDQGPQTFNDAILIAQCIRACTLSNTQPRGPIHHPPTHVPNTKARPPWTLMSKTCQCNLAATGPITMAKGARSVSTATIMDTSDVTAENCNNKHTISWANLVFASINSSFVPTLPCPSM